MTGMEEYDIALSRATIPFHIWNKEVEKRPCPICREKRLIVDVSMALIQCNNCGIAFEYRYNRGVIPYNTFINNIKEKK